MEKKFQEADYYLEFKRIRNKFRKYDSIGLLERAFDFLYHSKKDPIKQISKQPWNVLLFIKWILIDDNFYHKKRKYPSQKDFLNILQSVRDLGGKVRLPETGEDLRLFFRLFAFQQFHYQTNFNFSAFTRQFILFNDLPENHFYKKNFKDLTDLDIEDFLTMSLFLILKLKDKLRPVTVELVQSYFATKYSREQTEQYLNTISLNIEGARKWLKENNSNLRKSEEFYEQSKLMRYPLLKVGAIYYPYNLNILFRGLEYFVHDLLKEDNETEFLKRFGGIFEKYVHKLIGYSKSKYFTEDELLNKIKNNSKVVDFLILEGKNSVLLDAKGIEMHYKGKVSSNPYILKSKLKTSALKGIRQAFDLIDNLKQKREFSELNVYQNNFLIVVSFKELFLGNGVDFAKSIGKEFIKGVRKDYGDDLYIPLENIYFISVDDLELWVSLIRNKKISFSRGLIKAKKDDSNPKTSKFNFIQHILEWNLGF